jgi:hypothetical protein
VQANTNLWEPDISSEANARHLYELYGLQKGRDFDLDQTESICLNWVYPDEALSRDESLVSIGLTCDF